MLYQKILFMGTPEFSVLPLEILFKTYPDLIRTVITQPDKKRGRGLNTRHPLLKETALSFNIPVFQPNDKENLEKIVIGLNPDLIIVVAYGMILPKTLTDNYFCINIHASLLPQYRGASPIQESILRGDKKTGITLIKMNEKMDAGDILKQESLSILPFENYGNLQKRLSILGGRCLIDFLQNDLFPNQFTQTPQKHEHASYCKKINTSDGLILPTDTPLSIVQKINAFSPRPGAYIIHDNKRVKLLAAHIHNGKVILDRVQAEGKRPMPYQDYCLGNPDGLPLC